MITKVCGEMVGKSRFRFKRTSRLSHCASSNENDDEAVDTEVGPD